MSQLTGFASNTDSHFVETIWIDKMHFECNVNHHSISLDKSEEHGGDNTGPRPKPLMLAALAGCIGMEILAILNKMRIKTEKFNIQVTGTLNDKIPKVYISVHIDILIIPLFPNSEKIRKAVDLAVNNYCGVVQMFRSFSEVSFCTKFEEIL